MPSCRPARPVAHLLATFCLWGGSAAWAEPLLRCELTYAGATQTLVATPVADPYPVRSVDVGGRFRFKAVVVGAGGRVEHVQLYTYLETRNGPVLVQHASHRPPWPTGPSLTGQQRVYAGPVERELQYQCRLEGVAP